MLLSATEAIYSGDLPVKKFIANNSLAYKPKKFPFASFSNNFPLVITLSGAGTSLINGVVTLITVGGGNTYWRKSGSPRVDITKNINLTSWDIVTGFGGPNTYYYRVTGFDNNFFNEFAAPPLTGWYSLDPSYNPVPTLLFNVPASSTIDVIAPRVNNVPIFKTAFLTIQPNLSTNSYELSADNTFYGFASSTQFDNVTSVSIKFPFNNFDIDFFKNINNLTINELENLKTIGIFNKNNLNNLTITDNNAELINIDNNKQLTSLTITKKDTNKLSLNIANNSVLKYLNISYSELTSFDLTQFNLLENFTLSNTKDLTKLDFATNYPNLSFFVIFTSQLTGYDVPDTVLTILSSKLQPKYIINSTFNTLFGRSSATNSIYLDLYKKVESGGDFMQEIDPLYPIQTITDSYHPATFGNSYIVQNPVSSNNVQYVMFNALSGIYNKTNTTKDNRDVFKNANDFYILYSKDQNAWTVVGPTSTSNNMWLSAYAGYHHPGDIPVIGWSGPAININTFQNPTFVYSTLLTLFSSLDVSGNVLLANPAAGYNPNFYWDYSKFTGIGYQNVFQPTKNGRFYLISPVHVINTNHWPPIFPDGSQINFYDENNSLITRTCVSSVSLGADLRVGILNAPVNLPAYPIGSPNAFLTNVISPTGFNNFLWGPNCTSKFGVGLPNIGPDVGPAGPRGFGYSTKPDKYYQIKSVPKYLWHGERPIPGDSSTAFWYMDNGQPVLLSLTVSYGPTSVNRYSYYYTTIYNAATALCQQFYGSPLMYQLTAYNF